VTRALVAALALTWGTSLASAAEPGEAWPEAASGPPTFWDRARDPAAEAQAAALDAAVKVRLPPGVPAGMDLIPAFESVLALRAAAELRKAGGEALRDPGALYFLGDSLVLADRGYDEEARRVLLRALALDPASPLAARAWFDVAIASNRLREFETERDAYGEALRLQWDLGRSAGIYMNRGEASMALGRLDEAVRDYRTALALADDSEIHALASWGLAVALARDDNLPDALRYAHEAASVQFPSMGGENVSALDLPSVFFTPSYEIFYYRALGAMAASERAATPDERRTALLAALDAWKEYLDVAEERGDRWLENVRHQKRWCERRLEAR
jgi:tetratricopeptide (TPR) repeat protein